MGIVVVVEVIFCMFVFALPQGLALNIGGYFISFWPWRPAKVVLFEDSRPRSRRCSSTMATVNYRSINSLRTFQSRKPWELTIGTGFHTMFSWGKAAAGKASLLVAMGVCQG